MSGDGQDIHALFVRPFLDEADASVGKDRVDAVLGELGTTREALADPQGWLPLDLAGTLVERIVHETKDAAVFERAARLGFSSRYMGVLRPIVRALSSPRGGYVQMCSNLPRFNKTGTIRVVDEAPRKMTLVYECLPGFVERTGVFCRGRVAQMQAFPTIFDLPLARIEHPRCMQRGDPACVYDVSWTEPTARFLSRAALALGALGGGIAGFVTTRDPAVATAVAGAGAALGWSAARTVELGRDVAARANDVVEQNDALLRSVQANELRFAELREAKADVERKVEARTAELRATSGMLAQALDEVRALDRAKTDFFANVSHDLRTPLTLIVSPLEEMLAGREPPGGRAAALEAMHRNASRLLVLIHQLLDLAKIDAGQARLSRAPTDVLALVQRVLEGFAGAATARAVGLRVDGPQRLAAVAIDTAWIESAIANLVANAVRFAKREVVVVVRDEGDAVALSVRDDGAGIRAAELPRVFERFAQAGDDEARRGGTGLGLAIVAEAARLHGGTATVTSEEGAGATFTVRLPRAAPDEGPRPEPAGARHPSPAAALSVSAAPPRESEAPRDDGGTPLVLVAEDNDDLRAYVAAVLAPRYRVTTVPDGEAALAAVARERPDAVVTDLSMPGGGGMELLRSLRARPDTRSLPIILLTAHRDAQRVLEAFEAGANDYVTKPFHARELVARVDVHVAHDRLLAEVARAERLAVLGLSASSVAHGIRNPLTTLQSGLPALRDRIRGSLDARSEGLFDAMEDCAKRIGAIVTDLLDLARVDRAPEDLWPPSSGLLAAVRLLSVRSPPAVTFDVVVDETARIHCRPGELTDAFLNLLDNAARAVGKTGTVRVRAGVHEEAWVCSVEDSGPGIPIAERSRVFEPFVTTRPRGEGLGLGLAIAKRAVLQHGGTVEVEASDLGGAKFVLRIPVAETAGAV